MSATFPAVPATIRSLAGAGVLAVALASGATMVVAGAGRAAGIGVEIGGAPIPVVGFGVLTAIVSVVGLVLAAVLSRLARRPRSTFVSTTVVLTVLPRAGRDRGRHAGHEGTPDADAPGRSCDRHPRGRSPPPCPTPVRSS